MKKFYSLAGFTIALMFVFMVTSTSVQAQSAFDTRVASGNWSNPATWIKKLTGTSVTFTNGSANVTGVGTLFSSDLSNGDILLLQTSTGTVRGTVLSVTDNTHLTLTANYALTTATGAYGKEASPTFSDGAITILNNASITVDADVVVDQVVTGSGVTLTINSGVTLTVANGTGTDFSFGDSPDAEVNGSWVINNGAVLTGGGGNNATAGVLNVNSGGILNLNGTMNNPGNNSDWLTTIKSGGGLTVGTTGAFYHGLGNGVGITKLSISGTAFVSNGGTIVESTHSGTVVNSGGSLEMEPTSLMTGNSFTLSSGGTLKVGSAGGITAAAATGNIQTSTRTYDAGANYIYDGVAPQSIGDGFPANLTGSLTINNTGNIVTLGSARTFANGATLNLTAGTFAAGTNLTLSTTNTINRSEGSMTGTIQGAGTYNVNYSGGSKSSGSELSGSGLNNVTLNLSTSGDALTLSSAKTFSSVLTLTNGMLTTSSANLLTLSSTASASGASASSFVNGPMAKVGNSSFIFPLGKSGSAYHPLGISAPLLATDSYTAEYIRGSATALGNVTPPLDHVSACEYWNLERTAGASPVSVTLYWNANSPCNANSYITSPIGLVVAQKNGAGFWTSDGGAGFSGTTTDGNITSAVPATVFAPTPTYFTLGSTASNSPLPVKFAEFKGYSKTGGIQLDWTVSSEINENYYAVERSSDGRTFTALGQVAARNTGNKTDYGWFDANPNSGANFYRIRAVELSGKADYSIIVRVDLDKTVTSINIYPNPVTNKLVSYQAFNLAKGSYTVTVFSGNGQQVSELKFNHGGGSVSQSVQLPSGVQPGIYYLQIRNEDLMYRQKFIVQ